MVTLTDCVCLRLVITIACESVMRLCTSVLQVVHTLRHPGRLLLHYSISLHDDDDHSSAGSNTSARQTKPTTRGEDHYHSYHLATNGSAADAMGQVRVISTEPLPLHVFQHSSSRSAVQRVSSGQPGSPTIADKPRDAR